jgi:hypothetical protein
MTDSHRKSGLWVFAVASVFSGIICGCATSTTLPRTSGDSIEIPVKFVNVAGDVLPVDARPAGLELTLGPIAGSIWGTSHQYVQFVPIGRKSSIPLALDELSAKMDLQAAKASGVESGVLQVIPRDARFARVATGVWFKSKQPVTKSIGFLDAETRDTLTLVYFDRPCRLTGTLVGRTASGGTLTHDFDVDVESAGFVWIAAKRDAQDHEKEFRVVTPHPILVIAPPENLSDGQYQVKSQ